ncbi:VOC family protein [Bradyrhizobium liaoningense]|uniref:VOC family protein n=1 Tax=Bradyrhizobium liaoningense TaxID=43992 RepID=UPI001BAD448E|nr:VOC family protein [Bradyrhizobium liaoningense]MBR0706255.1 VOC family protein [Bradyrhizobium liaoningense]
MTLPTTNFDPGFRVTRASHLVLTVRDLAASRQFYEKVIGLIVTAKDGDALYLRGVEEACHHSLVLRQANDASCARLGLRVLMEEDLYLLKAFFAARGCPAGWVEVAHQGRTLHAVDPVGTPLEFCATMPVMPRMITKFTNHIGGSALRLDHYQVLTPEVRKACEFYTAAGFRLSEYIAPAGTSDLRGVFLQRKGNPHDIVFFNGVGPRLHHFAYLAPDVNCLLFACDLAGELGYGASVERGPGRHGPGHAMYVYMRDPDGHRVELFNTHYQMMDIENEPIAWDPSDRNLAFPWGLPARQAWFDEATMFAETIVSEPQLKPTPMTLEKYLARSNAGS